MDKNFNYLKKEEWLPKSPGAVPMDYFVWGYLKRLLFKSRVKDMAGFNSALKRAWNKVPQEIINKALASWPKCIYKIYKAKGSYIQDK